MKQFIFTNTDGYYEEGSVDGQGAVRACDASLAPGDLVCESSSITNGVDKVTSNAETRSVIGWVINKPTSTTAEILFKGTISGLSGLTKAGKVYLSASGGFGNAIPTGGYVQILGQAIDADTIDFDPTNTKIKLFKPGFNFPLSYTNIVPSSSTSTLGWCLDMDGNTLVIGSSGKIYVFTYDESSETWTEEAEITNSDGGSFGQYVRISGDTIVTGNHSYDANGYDENGRAYIYTRSGTTWTLKVTLDGPIQNYCQFGASVDVYGNIVAICSPNEDVNGDNDVGILDIYEFDGTNATLKQTIEGNTENGRFGEGGICIDGNKLLISEYIKKNVYLYEYNGSSWVSSETFYENQSNFGYSISIKDSKIAIGSDNYDDGSITCGAFYVYTYDGSNWNKVGPITASDKADGDKFGYAVSIYDDYAVVGAYSADPNGNTSAGKAYIFEFDGTNWIEKQIIEGTNAYDNLGSIVYVNENHIFVCARMSDLNGTNSGEVRDYKNS